MGLHNPGGFKYIIVTDADVNYELWENREGKVSYKIGLA